MKGASKLLGDCRPRNIVKELKKFQQTDKSNLEAANAALSSRVVELRVEMARRTRRSVCYGYRQKAWNELGKSWRIRAMS